VISGTGRRRRFPEDEKARILEETLAPGAIVSDIARRNGLTPQQLFTWRRGFRRNAAVSMADAPTEFVPVMIETSAVESRKEQAEVAPLIGFELEGASVWVSSGADASMVATIIRALKVGK
jgi:transposase